MSKKTFEESAPRAMPSISEDPAHRAALEQFGPEALAAAAKGSGGTTVISPPLDRNTETTGDTTATETSASAQTKPPAAVVEKPAAPKAVEPPPKPRVIAPKSASLRDEQTAAPAGLLQKKTVYPSEAGRQFLKRFRRSYKIAETLVAEYALELLFASNTDDAIAAPLRAVGHGLRRSRKDAAPRRPLTVYLNDAMRTRLETLRDDHDIAEGIVGGHAIDWLSAHQSEEQTVTALRERGYGYYRIPRVHA